MQSASSGVTTEKQRNSRSDIISENTKSLLEDASFPKNEESVHSDSPVLSLLSTRCRALLQNSYLAKCAPLRPYTLADVATARLMRIVFLIADVADVELFSYDVYGLFK